MYANTLSYYLLLISNISSIFNVSVIFVSAQHKFFFFFFFFFLAIEMIVLEGAGRYSNDFS